MVTDIPPAVLRRYRTVPEKPNWPRGHKWNKAERHCGRFFGAGWMWICGDQQYFAGGVLDALHDLRTSTDGKQNQKIVVVHIGRGLSQKIIGNSPHGAALLPHQDLEQLCRLEAFGKAGGVNVGVVVDVLR